MAIDRSLQTCILCMSRSAEICLSMLKYAYVCLKKTFLQTVANTVRLNFKVSNRWMRIDGNPTNVKVMYLMYHRVCLGCWGLLTEHCSGMFNVTLAVLQTLAQITLRLQYKRTLKSQCGMFEMFRLTFVQRESITLWNSESGSGWFEIILANSFSKLSLVRIAVEVG